MFKKLLSVLLAIMMICSLSVPFVSAQETSIMNTGSDAEIARERLDNLLSQAVSILQSPDVNTYTSQSCALLEQAMSEAYTVYYNPDATADRLNAQAEKLDYAINNLQKKGVSENAAYYLSSAIITAESAVGSELDYTPDSYTVYFSALTQAKRMQTEAQSDEEAIAAAEALNTAVKNLVPVASNVSQARDYLRLVINKAYNTLDSDSNFTAESLQMLESAIESANRVYNNTSATAQQLYYEADMLENVMNSMEEVAVPERVREYLADVISQADAQVESEENYTAESWSVYFDAYQQAKRVQSLGTTEEEFISAANALGVAMNSLVRVDVLITAARDVLLSSINSAHGFLGSTEKYTAESIARLEAALDSANAVYVKADATLEELQSEDVNLQDAMAMMEEIVISEEIRSYLQDVIAMADGQVGREEKYTPESWNTYITAYNKAVKVLSDGESDEEFITAANALGNAVEGLVLKDTDRQSARAELLSLIEKGVPEGEYTAESLAILEVAKADAEAIYSDEDASLADIQGAIVALEKAYENLAPFIPVPESKKKLAELVVSADGIENCEYFAQNNWDGFTVALANAKSMLEGEFSDEEYLSACEELEAAMNNLLSDVRQVLNKHIETGAPVGGNYTSESYGRLIDALDNAREVYDNENAGIAEIIAEIQSVKDARNGLQIVQISDGAKQTLWNVIEKSQSEVGERKDYTPESWSVYSDAYSDAMGTYYYGQTEAEYYLAAQKLQSAMDDLVLKSSIPAEPTPDEVTVLLGDVDGDSKVTIKDATFIQKCVAGLNTLEASGEFSADANRDGTVNIKDATEIQKYLAGLKAHNDIDKEITVAVNS